MFASATANASETPPPWASGLDQTSPLEAVASDIASDIAARPVQVRCHGPEEWRRMIMDLRFPDGSRINGFVTFSPDGRPGDWTELSDSTCLALDAFWRNGAREKRCHFGTTRETVERSVTVKVNVKRKVRVKVAGKWMTKTKTVVESRRVIRLEHRRVPILLPCADSFDHLLALWVLAHEAEHLAGTQEEAVAECRGLQTLMFVALRLGADPSFAREMAAEAWRAYPELRGGTEFYSTDCRDGGPLDLNPASPVWP